MPGLVYVVAPKPWGPVRIEHAANSADLLTRITTAPAHVQHCGALDASHVAAAALALLPPPGEDGWIMTRVEIAKQAVQDAYKLAQDAHRDHSN